jgi:lysyl-tRNA synthetase class 1
MRGVAIHGAVHEALTKMGVPNTFKYELNDFDPMDDIPAYLDQEKYKEYLGKPLKNIPSPEPGFASFAEYFADEFRKVIEGAGWHPEFYWGSSLYESGKMDGAIRAALEHAADVIRIYKEVSGSQRAEEWLPINVICPECGKVTTTEASNFDGETVEVHCRPDKAPYTKGCDFKGRVSPFGGKAKLAWKVEWPAKWFVNGVAVEGGGKDHSTKGGSRDVGNHVAKEVFGYEPPFDIPYEFFLVGGQKMSSSKGRGSSAKDISSLVPAKIFRLALLGKDISQQTNFDPMGDTIPVLYDQFDRLAESYKTGVKDNYTRLFEFLGAAAPLPEYFPRFSQVAFLAQMPHLDMEAEVAAMKGSALTAEDKAELSERAEYARKWLGEYAPEKFVFKLQETLPEAAVALSEVQKKALKTLHAYISGSEAMPSGEDQHQFLHGLKESEPIAPGELFSAIYLAFLGKPMGPKAGWFISVLPRDYVLKRLEEATA